MKLKQRTIEIYFTLDSSLTFINKNNTKTIASSEENPLSIDVDIRSEGAPSSTSAKITVANMVPEDIELLTTLNFKPNTYLKNTAAIFAGYDNQLQQVFSGTIIKGSGRYGVENVYECEAVSGFWEQKKTMPMLANKGTIDALQLMKEICGEIKYKFVDNVAGKKLLTNPVLTGSAIDRLNYIAKATGILLDINNETVTVYETGSAKSNTVILLNAESGMIGYPSFDENGIIVRSYFNPNIKNGILLKVESEVKNANGTWRIITVNTQLQNYGGNFMHIIRGQYVSN